MPTEWMGWALGVLALLGSGGLGGLLWRLQGRFHALELRVAMVERTAIDDKHLQPLLDRVVATIGAKVDRIEREFRESADRMAGRIEAVALTVAGLAAREGTTDYTALNAQTIERHRRGG